MFVLAIYSVASGKLVLHERHTGVLLRLDTFLLKKRVHTGGGGEHDLPSRKRLTNTSSGIVPLKEKEGENGTKSFFLMILFVSQCSRIAKQCLSR